MSDSNEEPTEPPAPGPKVPKAVLGLLAVNLLVSGGTLCKTIQPQAAHAQAAPAAAPTPPGLEISGPVSSLDPFVVNLNETGSSRYLKVQLQIELRNAAAVKAMEKSKQLVRDRILGY